MNRVMGFDPSLTSSGYAGYDMVKGTVTSGIIKTRELRGVERLLYLQEQFEILCNTFHPVTVFYEGYSMGSHSGRNFDIGEMGGVLKMFAYTHNIPLVLVPPSVLKKFITGKGNASKEEVILKLYKRYGFEAPRNDEADAIGLYLLGDAYLNGDPKVDDLIPKCQIIQPQPSLRRRRVRRIFA